MASFRKLVDVRMCGRLKTVYLGTGLERFSTSSRLNNDKVYELRTYYMHPQHVKGFMELCAQKFHVRTAQSKLIGFWTSEIGGLNDILHLWEFENLDHRAQVRKSLVSNQEWANNFISKVLPMYIRQDNSLVMCLPGTTILQPAEKGFYEIQTFDYGDTDLQAVSSTVQRFNKAGATLLGSFYTVIGQLSSGFLLWHHPSVNSISQLLPKIDKSSDIKFGHSRLLLPTAWSPMQ